MSAKPTGGYVLTFVTAANKLYQVDFEPYFFQLNQNVFVSGPFLLQEVAGTIKAFDVISQIEGDTNLFVIGASVPTGEPIEQQSLYLIRSD